MVTASQYVQHVGDLMTQAVNNLFTALGDLQPNWKSPSASAAFWNAQGQWQGAHNDLMKAINEIANDLATSKTQYDQAEQDSQDGITNAARGLNYYTS